MRLTNHPTVVGFRSFSDLCGQCAVVVVPGSLHMLCTRLYELAGVEAVEFVGDIIEGHVSILSFGESFEDCLPVVLDAHHRPPVCARDVECVLGPVHVVELAFRIVMEHQKAKCRNVRVFGELQHR